MDLDREMHRRRASGITVVAQMFGLMSIILMLVWLLHYRGGLDLNSDSNPYKILNVHPFMMFFGFIFFAGQAMMAYKTIGGAHSMQKTIHMLTHIVAIILGIVGIYAAFKYHDRRNLTNMYTLHSWIGLATFILYGVQWLFGFATYWVPRPESTRIRTLPWHICFGRALLYMAICAAETGLMQIFTILNLVESNEARLLNFLGLTILLFGITVDLSIFLGRYV